MSRGKWKKESLLKICRSGKHLFTKENTGIKPCTGFRYCKECARERVRRWREKNSVKIT